MYQEINVEYRVVPLSLHKEATRKLVNTKLNLWKTIPSVSTCKPCASREKKHPKEEFLCVCWLQSNQASPAATGKFSLIKVVLYITFLSQWHSAEHWTTPHAPQTLLGHASRRCVYFFPSSSLLRSKLDRMWCWHWALLNACEAAGSAQHMEQLSTGIFGGPDFFFRYLQSLIDFIFHSIQFVKTTLILKFWRLKSLDLCA